MTGGQFHDFESFGVDSTCDCGLSAADSRRTMKARTVCLWWQSGGLGMLTVHGGKFQLGGSFGLFSYRRIPTKEGTNINHYCQWPVLLRTTIHPQRIPFFIYNSKKETQFYYWVDLKKKKKFKDLYSGSWFRKWPKTSGFVMWHSPLKARFPKAHSTNFSA